VRIVEANTGDPQKYATVGEALAAIGNSGTIFIGPGTYSEGIDIVDDTIGLIGNGDVILAATGSTHTLDLDNGANVYVQGVTISQVGTGYAVRMRDNSDAVFYDVTIGPSNQYGIMLEGSADRVELHRCVVHHNGVRGLYLDGSGGWVVENSFIVNNGGAQGRAPVFARSVGTFHFNTVAQNQNGSESGAVRCDMDLALVGSIFFDNAGIGQLSNNCQPSQSLVDGIAPGGTNQSADPLFVDVQAGNYHIERTSPCRDFVDGVSTLVEDFDRHPRPQGLARECGADEVQK
jgi:Right handed beta helix region